LEERDMPTRPLHLVLAAGLILGAASTAAAQGAAQPTPTWELSAGYQFLHLPDQNFPFGINLDGAQHFGRMGLVAEAGWARHSDEVGDFEASTNMWSFGAGPRFTGFNPGRAWPYAQVIVGAVVAHSSIDDDAFDEDLSDTQTSFMLQPGVGMTFVAGDGWGIFGQFDYRRTFFEEPDDVDSSINNQFRIFVGARMILE
jgi:hypothetical protein